MKPPRCNVCVNVTAELLPAGTDPAKLVDLYILQRGLQWKQGVVLCAVIYTILL